MYSPNQDLVFSETSEKWRDLLENGKCAGLMVHTVTPVPGRSKQDDGEFKINLSCVETHPVLPSKKLPSDDTWNKNAGMMVMGLNKMIHLIRNDKAITLWNTADKI